MDGATLGLSAGAGSARWYLKNTLKLANVAGGNDLGPAAIFDFRRRRFAATPLSVSAVAAASAGDLSRLGGASMEEVLAFARASVAIYRSAAGTLAEAGVDEPRLDLSAEHCMLLREPASINLVVHSEDFTQSAWEKDAVNITAGAVEAGVLSLTDMTRNGSVSAGVEGSLSLENGETYSYSIYLKKKDGGTQRFGVFSNTDALWRSGVEIVWPGSGALSETDAAAIAGVPDAAGSISVEDIGNGIYRLSYVSSYGGAGADDLGLRIEANHDADLSGNYAGGIQVEKQQYPTSYIPTGATAVTRAADIVRLSAKLEALLQRPESTLFVRYRTVVSPSGRDQRRYLICGADTGFSRYNIRCSDVNSLSPQAWVGDGSANSGFSRPSDISAGQIVAVALAVGNAASNYFVNGEASLNNPGGGFDNVSNNATEFYLGSDTGGQSGEQILLEEVRIYPFEVKAESLLELTA